MIRTLKPVSTGIFCIEMIKHHSNNEQTSDFNASYLADIIEFVSLRRECE